MAVAEAKCRDGPDFSALPEGCIASIVSFTSPPDACRFASVSSIFKSACDSDAVWVSFLPPDCRSMVPRSVSSLKELYFSLCDDPILVDDGKISFSLDRHSGKKCIMLSARALYRRRGDTPRYWSWNPMADSRFAEVAELINVCWLEIRGTINSRMLSPGTLYAAYLVFKLTPESYGLYTLCAEVRAGFAGDEVGKRERSVFSCEEAECRGSGGNYPSERRDGWSEIELGEFLTKDGEDDGEVEMRVLHEKGGHWKRGLVVEGIEIRPKYKKQECLYAEACVSL